MASKFIPEEFIGKPARIGWVGVYPLLDRDDGKGNATVKFQVQLGLQDKDGKYITAKGEAKYDICVYQSAYYSNDPRVVLAGGLPQYYEGRANEKAFARTQPIKIASFHQDSQGRPCIDIVTTPIKLKIDVVEWRYVYIITFYQSVWKQLRHEHTSSYYHFNFHFNEKEIREIRSLIKSATKFPTANIAYLSTCSDERLRGMSSVERQQLLQSLREFHNEKTASSPKPD